MLVTAALAQSTVLDDTVTQSAPGRTFAPESVTRSTLVLGGDRERVLLAAVGGIGEHRAGNGDSGVGGRHLSAPAGHCHRARNGSHDQLHPPSAR